MRAAGLAIAAARAHLAIAAANRERWEIAAARDCWAIAAARACLANAAAPGDWGCVAAPGDWGCVAAPGDWGCVPPSPSLVGSTTGALYARRSVETGEKTNDAGHLRKRNAWPRRQTRTMAPPERIVYGFKVLYGRIGGTRARRAPRAGVRRRAAVPQTVCGDEQRTVRLRASKERPQGQLANSAPA